MSTIQNPKRFALVSVSLVLFVCLSSGVFFADVSAGLSRQPGPMPDSPPGCNCNSLTQMQCQCGGSECACCSNTGSCICTGDMPGCGS
jgi:hypothetical protein